MKRARSGFSLMELLVVLAILSAAAALIGPNMFKAFDKAQMRNDKLVVSELFEKLSFKAFITNRQINVVLSKNQIEYYFADTPENKSNLTLEHLAFPPQTFTFTRVGEASVFDISHLHDGKSQSMRVLEVSR